MQKSTVYNPKLKIEKKLFDVIKWRVMRQTTRWPRKLESQRLIYPAKRILDSKLSVSVVGHATFLIQTQGLNILTDPIWSKRASPFKYFGPKRVTDPGIIFDQLPPIDVVWVSHNHYDHLDLATIDRLWEAHKPRIIVPLGNDLIIKSHNSSIDKIEAYNWGESTEIGNGVKFHIESTQHWSARGLFDHNNALWAALVIETPAGNIYFAGDTGYGDGKNFVDAKQKFGSFRLAMLPIGAYEPRWFMQDVHMNPEEAVMAHIDLGMPYTIPYHYDVFELGDENYGDAIRDLEKAKTKLKVDYKFKPIQVGSFLEVPTWGW